MRVLVTGGSGFIGSRLIEQLLKGGHSLRILDKVVSKRYPDLCLIGDVRDPEAVNSAVKDVDLVFHLAAEHRDDVRPISLYYDVNVTGAKVLADACVANDVRRIIFTSSVAIYGLNAGKPSESTTPNPFNDYGKSKLEAEAVLSHWSSGGSSRHLTVVRPTVVFGEGNRGNVYNLIKQVTSGRFIMVGDGLNRKSMAYVGNVAAFLCFLAESVVTDMDIYNYADKPDLSMNELVEQVREFMGKSSEKLPRIPLWLGMAGGFFFDALRAVTGKDMPVSYVRVQKFCADTTITVSKLRHTGFAPPYTLGTGLDNFLQFEFPATGCPGVIAVVGQGEESSPKTG